MKLFPVHPVIWSSLLVLWFPQSAETEGHGLDFCHNMDDDYDLSMVQVESSTGEDSDEEITENETFICLLYPTNELNCSWSFHTLEEDTQLSVYVSVCDNVTAVKSLKRTSAERVGSISLTLSENLTDVFLHFNMSLHNKWKSYTYMYNMDTLELLSPPPNISASVKDGALVVTWDLPRSRNVSKLECFEYELDISDQEKPKYLESRRSYIEPNADPMRAYGVRIRTRITSTCFGSSHWSEWSHTVMVEPSVSTLNPLVIILISLGIPMILLAVLLFVRYQRVTKILFPPIPRPPPKYKYFLEKSDTFNFFFPAPSAKPEEEITEVEDTEKNPGKTG